MNQQNQTDFETFEIGGGIGDIGGDEIDLASLNITDTLIGQTASELTAALGEPSLNDYEAYHMGDGGISDIELVSFDSALINEAGVRPYTADEAASIDEMSELAELMGKKLDAPKAKKEPAAKKAAAPEKKETGATVAGILAKLKFVDSADKMAADLLEDETAPTFVDEVFDENGQVYDIDAQDDEDFDEADFFMELDEIDTLQSEFDSKKHAELLVV